MKRGFTFLEVVICIAILGFIALGIYNVLNVGDMTWRSEMVMASLQEEVRRSLDGMVREIRQAQPPVTITGGNRIDFTIPQASGTISYYLDDFDSDGNSDDLIREYPSGTKKMLAKDISSLSFSSSGNTVSIALVGQRSARGRTLTFSLKQKVRLRNE